VRWDVLHGRGDVARSRVERGDIRHGEDGIA
jgi:hypothetical protein